MTTKPQTTSEYFDLYKKYKRECGNKTVLFMQVGSFYEMYSIRDANGNYLYTEIDVWSSISGLNIAVKSNIYNIPELNNVKDGSVVMIGFKPNQVDKYIPKFQDEGYTIVIYDQLTIGKNKQIKRELNTIISPGTYFIQEETIKTNNIMCLWIEGYRGTFSTHKSKHGTLTFGVSVINILTGKSHIHEFSEEYIEKMHTTFNELERIMTIYKPNELIFISNLSEFDMNNILKFVNCDITTKRIYSITDTIVNEHVRETMPKIVNCENQIFQHELLKKTFNPNDFSFFIQEFNNYPVGTQAYSFLIDFVNMHNTRIVSSIEVPIFETSENRLILENHSLRQLNIIDDSVGKGKFSSVLKLLNKCVSNMGKRELENSLLNPVTDIDKLNIDYDTIEHIINSYDKFNCIRDDLRNVNDIEKFNRQLHMNKINFNSLINITKSLNTVKNIYDKLKHDKKVTYYIEQATKSNISNECQEIINFIERYFNLDGTLLLQSKIVNDNNTIDEPVLAINKGIDKELDELLEKYITNIQLLKEIQIYMCHILNELPVNDKIMAIKINEKEKQGITLVTTKNRKETLTKQIKKKLPILSLPEFSYLNNNYFIGDITFKVGSTKSEFIIYHDIILKICNDLIKNKELLQEKLQEIFNKFANECKIFSSNLKEITKYVTFIDLITTKAHVAKLYNYSKPNIISSKDSFVNVKKLRHALIEHINNGELYVTNDICLEKKCQCNGFLLFGTNTVGKTSLIRALGISVIMAQAGFYVPCESMQFSPYKYIFTRILNTDNLFQGQSTFMVEMCELRQILKRANNKSLILGDELCSGTEIDSAVSLFVAGLIQLHNKNSNFIFATHLHMITKFKELCELEYLKYKHLTVVYDAVKNKLVYDRKLKDGQGETLYGLEVCKSLDLPNDFIDIANSIRERYVNKSHFSNNLSRYNSKVLKDKCIFCNKQADHIHHLQYQQDANDNGYIDSFNKNHPANLVSLCEECHSKVHSENKRYIVKKTSYGNELFEK